MRSRCGRAIAPTAADRVSGSLRAVAPGRALAFVLVLAAGGCAPGGPSPSSPAVPAEAPPSRASIRVPEGDCVTGTVELQVYDRARGLWVAHPQRPRARTGTCLEERSDRLLTDLRLRCVDPAGIRPPSAWVHGTELGGAAVGGPCPGAAPE